jgi:hypothetical protein
MLRISIGALSQATAMFGESEQDPGIVYKIGIGSATLIGYFDSWISRYGWRKNEPSRNTAGAGVELREMKAPLKASAPISE